MPIPGLPRLLLVTLALALFATVGYEAQRLAGLGSAFTAKYMCSEVFVGGSDADTVARVDLPAFHSFILSLADWHLDKAGDTVSADIFGAGRHRAVYRPGLGCTLVFDRPPVPVRVPQPHASGRPDDFPPPALRKVSILIEWGRLRLTAPAPAPVPVPVPEWSSPTDPRHAITLDELLHMSSGLEFDESYDDPLSDVVQMLYGTGDSAAYAAAEPLATRRRGTSAIPRAPLPSCPASSPDRRARPTRCSPGVSCSLPWG